MNKNTNRFSEEHRQADSIVRIEKQTSSNTQKSSKKREWALPNARKYCRETINNTQINGTE